jgi:hypothetical protein
MNKQFSTQAANADILGDDTPNATTEGMSDAVGADGTPRDRADRRQKPQPPNAAAPEGDAKPGKDINAPGFVKDKDAAKPS